MAEGFGAPHEVFAMFAEPALAKTEHFTFYLAEADGVPVGTGMSAVTDHLVGVFNISVLPQHRRQGHGQASRRRSSARGGKQAPRPPTSTPAHGRARIHIPGLPHRRNPDRLHRPA
ncbi:N-acetyltransferase [Streptomyces sp. T1317-0309]|nr:N-acetyltransferase [Streptomyces sp. T1317-0309]